MRQSKYAIMVSLILLFIITFFCNSILAETLWQGIPEKGIKLNAGFAPDKFNAMRFIFSDEKTRMEISLKHKTDFGKTRYEVKHGFQVDSIKGLEQLYDKLPQFPGEYEISLSGKGGSCTVLLENLTDLEPISYGEEPGELLIENAGNSFIEAHSERIFIKAAGFKDSMKKGISTPDGSMLFRLPAGYWSLERMSTPVEVVQLIPVHSGKRTVISWAVIPRINLESESGKTASRLEIREVKADADGNATLRFAMPAGLTRQAPKKEALKISEHNRPGEIIELSESETPLHLVMLLDSSGSMKKDMKKAIDSTVKFIEKLPENANVEVIDFDTKPRLIKASGRKELLQAIRSIKADGATALRDSIILGIKKLKGSARPALVVFTDGFDANHNDTAPGSKATEKEMIARVSEVKIPVFTIGFGENADEATLSRIADMSGGEYQSASSASLDAVFESLKETVAREYLLKWKRPSRTGVGMKPVISISIDTSGSMSDRIENGKPGERFEMASFALHEMVKKLPEDCLVQLIDYDDKVKVTQTSTASRARMHKGIAGFDRGGGTDIITALKVNIEGLLSAPSSRRYLFFLTDAAIKQSGKDKIKFERLLDRLRDEKIYSMWLGMVDDPEFQKVAERSGGVAVISKNFNDLQKTISDLLSRIGEPSAEHQSAIELVWKMPVENALPQPVSGTGIFELQQMPVSKEAFIDAKDSLSMRISDINASSENNPGAESANSNNSPADRNSGEKAQDDKLSDNAESGMAQNARLTIPVDINAQNSAASFHVSSVAMFDSIDGIKAPKEMVFAAITMKVKNILPEQEVTVYPDGSSHPSKWIGRSDSGAKVLKATPPYLIKDIRKHLFLRWNDQIVPVSPATWLVENSLLPFCSYSLKLMPAAAKEGRLVFLVSDRQGLTSGALDFYDTAYGHANINLAGVPIDNSIKVSSLPEKISGKLGDAFDISVDAVTDVSAPLAGANAGPHLVYRLIDMTIDSKVQALLDIKPAERMHLAINTDKGPVRRPLSKATALLPNGFFSPAKLSPGSANFMRQAYLIPAQLASTSKGILYIDMKNKDLAMDLGSEARIKGPDKWDTSGNGMKIRINNLERTSKKTGFTGDWLLVDATVADELDGSATRLQKLFFLGREDLKSQGFQTKARIIKTSDNKAFKKGMGKFSDNKESEGNAPRIYPDRINSKLIFGANESAVVPDGQELRFITAIKVPSKGSYLLAADNPALTIKLPADSGESIPEWLLAQDDEAIPALPDSFEKAISSRLKQIAPEKKENSETDKFVTADETGATIRTAENLSPPLLAPDSLFPESVKQKVILNIEVEPLADNAAAQTNKAASALSGKSGSRKTFTLLAEKLPPDIARTPFEIVYTSMAGDSGGTEIKALLSGAGIEVSGQKGINLKEWKPVKEIIKISGSKFSFPVFERDISDCDITSRIHSIAMGISDIDEQSEASLAENWAKSRIEAAPDHISIWRWYAHARFARFIADQSRFEREKAGLLGLTLNRDKKPRLMIITGGKGEDTNSFEARLDLLSVMPEISGTEEACRAFRLANGIFLSDLEAHIMKGKGVFQFWGRNNVFFIAPSGKQKSAWLKFASAKGVSESVINAIKKSKAVIMFPEKPAIVNDKPFWSWIEIDPKTYEMIGILETGERGTIAGEAIIQALIPDGAGLMLGFMKGIETAVWGQCAFIVGGYDYEEALDKTEELIGNLGEHLGKIGDSFSVPVGDAELDLISGKMTLEGFSSDGTYSPWEGYKSFGSGFEMGAQYYLEKARAAGKK